MKKFFSLVLSFICALFCLCMFSACGNVEPSTVEMWRLENCFLADGRKVVPFGDQLDLDTWKQGYNYATVQFQDGILTFTHNGQTKTGAYTYNAEEDKCIQGVFSDGTEFQGRCYQPFMSSYAYLDFYVDGNAFYFEETHYGIRTVEEEIADLYGYVIEAQDKGINYHGTYCLVDVTLKDGKPIITPKSEKYDKFAVKEGETLEYVAFDITKTTLEYTDIREGEAVWCVRWYSEKVGEKIMRYAYQKQGLYYPPEKKLLSFFEGFGWIQSLQADDVVQMQHEFRKIGIAPGSFTSTVTTENDRDVNKILEYLTTLKLRKLDNWEGKTEGGTARSLTIYTETEKYEFSEHDGYYNVDGTYYELITPILGQSGKIPGFSHGKVTYGFVTYADEMTVYADGELVGTYENILGDIAFGEDRTVSFGCEEDRICYEIGADFKNLTIYDDIYFSYDGVTYKIVGEVNFSQYINQQ